MTQRQSNDQWNGCIAANPPPQKKSKCKNPLESSRLDLLRSKWHPPLSLSSKGPNYQRRVLLITAGAIAVVDILKEKSRGKFTKGVLFLHDNAPAHRALATQKKLAYLGFQYLDHPPYSPVLAPSDCHLFHGLKKQLKGRHFSSDADVIPAAENWLDGQLSKFFLVACKS